MCAEAVDRVCDRPRRYSPNREKASAESKHGGLSDFLNNKSNKNVTENSMTTKPDTCCFFQIRKSLSEAQNCFFSSCLFLFPLCFNCHQSNLFPRHYLAPALAAGLCLLMVILQESIPHTLQKREGKPWKRPCESNYPI